MGRTLEELEQAHREGTNPLSYVPLAEELRKRRQYDRALSVCRDGLRRQGSSVRGQTILGRILLDGGHLDDAIEAFRIAIELAPGSFDPHLLLARALTQRSDYLEAREVLAALVASNAGSPEVQQLRRVIDAEIGGSRSDSERLRETASPENSRRKAPSLRDDLEAVPGVEAIFDFGMREIRGDLVFDEAGGEELDDDAKVMLVNSWRLCSKLNFNRPRVITLEASSGTLVLRVQGSRGVLAVTTPRVKSGQLRYLMDQYVRAGAG